MNRSLFFVRLLIVLPCFVLLCSCTGPYNVGQHFWARSMGTPKRAISLDPSNSSYSAYLAKTRYNYADVTAVNYFRTAYDTPPAGSDQKTVRNQIAKEMVALIDENHAIYHDSLRKMLTANNVIWDFLTMGLTTGATVSTGAQATRVLSAIATGTNGFGGKMNGRILQEQTLAAVLKAIRIRKEQAYARMRVNFGKLPGDYDLEDVIVDLGQYWEAGLLASGIQQLDEMTSKTLSAVEEQKNKNSDNKTQQAKDVLKVVNPKTGGE